jgi:hypothetical protein
MAAPSMLFDGPEAAPLTVALAHGAGVGMDSPFMAFFAEGLAQRGFRAARFEFPYMARRRAEGRPAPPDRPEVLLSAWRSVIAALGPNDLVIGGKSLGGRLASALADEAGVKGLFFLGYPFHAPGRPDNARIGQLAHLRTPTLVLQGERDPLGNADEVAGYDLSPSVRLHWLPGGDHGFKPTKASGLSERDNWEEALAALADFLSGL